MLYERNATSNGVLTLLMNMYIKLKKRILRVLTDRNKDFHSSVRFDGTFSLKGVKKS